MATVTKFVKGLIGKEDINWGTASSTFSRETYTGGNINVHYVDDSVIPSSKCGGYVDDHLHKQNTDTGTTGTTWTIDSDGTGVTLSTTGITAGRTFTFPDTGNQQLTGASSLASTAANYGASLVGVQDSGGYFGNTNVETVLAESGASLVTLFSTSHNSGMKNGFKLAYSSGTAITISGGVWAHDGTTDQHVYTASQVTFTLGPAGSNAASSNLGADEIHYIYIDDSAVVAGASRLLTASEFVNSTTAPSWSHSRIGWYNGSDRCIGAVLTSSASTIVKFSIHGKNYYRYRSGVTEYAGANAPTTYTALDLSSSVPAFSTMSRLKLDAASGTSTRYYFDTESSGTTPEAHVASQTFTTDIPLSSSQVVYWYATAATGTSLFTVGYYTDEL